MPFMRAGFNFRHKSTNVFGWTRPVNGKRFALAELIRFTPSGDLAWIDAADKPKFLAWGEQVVIGSRPEFDLPMEWQHGLPQSALNMKPKPRSLATKLELPYPVSANRYWRHVPNKRTGLTMHFLSGEAKAYKEAVAWIARASGFRNPTEKQIEIVSITLVPRRYNDEGVRIGGLMDLGNCWKIAEDALQGVVYVNDRQIKRFGRIEYGEPTDHGALIVEVAEFVHASPPLFALEAAA